MQKEKLVMASTALALAFSLIGCGSSSASTNTMANTSLQTEQEQTVDSVNTEDNGVEEIASESSGTVDTQTDDQKILIVYFSPANADTVDAVSSATPRVGDVSSVEYVAQLIGSQVDADMARIVPKDPYPTVYEQAADKAKAEADNDERPEFTLDVNPEGYDVIFVGYPIWWFHMPMVMQTFFDSYDFSGKTIIPFNNHAGSRDGGTYSDIAKLELGATVLDGLAINGEGAQDAQSDVQSWLSGLDY